MIPRDALILLEEIRKSGKKLNPQENGFIASISIQSKQGRYLQPKQAKWLQDIYGKCSGGGQYVERQYIK